MGAYFMQNSIVHNMLLSVQSFLAIRLFFGEITNLFSSAAYLLPIIRKFFYLHVLKRYKYFIYKSIHFLTHI